MSTREMDWVTLEILIFPDVHTVLVSLVGESSLRINSILRVHLTVPHIRGERALVR